MALTREQEHGESGRAGEVNVTVTAQLVDLVNKVWLIWSCQAEEKRQTTDVVKGACMGLM